MKGGGTEQEQIRPPADELVAHLFFCPLLYSNYCFGGARLGAIRLSRSWQDGRTVYITYVCEVCINPRYFEVVSKSIVFRDSTV